MTPVQETEPWMPNGFPPPSFVVETERTTRTLLGSRRRWLAAAAILGVLLLIAGVLLIARQGKDKTALTTGTSTTSGNSDSTQSTDTSVLDPAATLPDATTAPGGGGGPTLPGAGATTPGGGTTGPPGPTTPPPPPGILALSTAALRLAPATAGKPSSGTLNLMNTGPGSLDYNTEHGQGLNVAPPTGTIASGANVTVTITFAVDDPSLGAGAYSGRVVFAGTGGAKTVTVDSVVGRPPTIAPAGRDNNNKPSFIQPALGNKTPCTAAWSIKVGVAAAESQASIPDGAVKVRITRNGNSVESPMTRDPNPNFWTLKQDNPESAPPNVKFTVKAVDSLGAETTTPEQTVTC